MGSLHYIITLFFYGPSHAMTRPYSLFSGSVPEAHPIVYSGLCPPVFVLLFFSFFTQHLVYIS